MPDYLDIPVFEAKKIADGYRKAQVVILAWDDRHHRMHTTTYGVSAGDKVAAASIGEQCARAIGCDLDQKECFEDFRNDFDPAFLREAEEMLRQIYGRQGCSPAMLGQIERWLKARGRGLRQG
jgi:hypothetical protein